MLKTETSLFIPDTERSIKDGRLSMLTNTQMNQLKDSLTRNSDSLLREISTLSHHSIATDTLT
jgi:hypothetical protein